MRKSSINNKILFNSLNPEVDKKAQILFFEIAKLFLEIDLVEQDGIQTIQLLFLLQWHR